MQKFDDSWAQLVNTVQTALRHAAQGKESPAQNVEAPADHDTIAYVGLTGTSGLPQTGGGQSGSARGPF